LDPSLPFIAPKTGEKLGGLGTWGPSALVHQLRLTVGLQSAIPCRHSLSGLLGIEANAGSSKVSKYSRVPGCEAS
jgi:hypothetical protein